MKIKQAIKNYFRIIVTLKYYMYDMSHLFTSIFSKKSYNYDKILSTIQEKMHQIEKGLTKSNFRYCFGYNSLKILTDSLERFYSLFPDDLSNTTYLAGIDSLFVYLYKHEGILCTNLDMIKNTLARIGVPKFNSFAGIEIISNEELSNINCNEYKKIVFSRRSIRDFDNIKVSDEDLEEVLNVAQHSPSACNRQGWKTRVVSNENMINNILHAHGGLGQNGEYISHLLIVTGLKNYYGYPSERNQVFIDSSLYCMNLMFSLTSKKIGSCPLNVNFNRKKYNKIAHQVNIKNNEIMIMIIAIGHYKNENKVAISKRKTIGESVIFFK